MRPALLQTGPLIPALEARLAERFEVTHLKAQGDPVDYLRREGHRFVAIASSAAIGFEAALLPHLPALQVVSHFGVGLDRLPVGELKARGVAVSSTSGVLDQCVADAAWALLLATARRVTQADQYVRSGEWARNGLNRFALGRRVSGARLGVVGMGHIGQAIARRAGGFDMRVAYHTRNAVAGCRWPHVPVLTDLARQSDFLVVITAGGPATRHLINADVLAALGPRGFLVNVSRGSVVDEAALLAALHSGGIAGAGLDVFEQEPAINEAWRTAPNTVLMPHAASATEETRQAMADLVVDNLDSFFATGRLLTPL